MEPRATKLAALLSQGQRTTLTPDEEGSYQRWVALNNIPQSDDYNMRGFFKSMDLPGAQASGVNANDGQIHFPDTFKLPNHETFSTDSGYYDPQTMPQTPSWQGGKIGKTGGESWSLRRPSGQVVESEAPWIIKRLLGF